MSSRREFLKSSATAGFVLGTGTSGLLSALSPRVRGEAEVTPELVHLTPDVEPIVRLIEETPRDKCFELIVGQLQQGLPYRNFLAALFLAGVRNVSPHPVGFKFHCVLAMHSANQLSLDAAPEDRLLPLFWCSTSSRSRRPITPAKATSACGSSRGRCRRPRRPPTSSTTRCRPGTKNGPNGRSPFSCAAAAPTK